MPDPDLTALIANMISKFEDLIEWCISNKLAINAKETNFVLFHTINKAIPQHLNEIKTEFMTSILKIDDTHKYNTLGIVNEIVSDRCPAIFRNYFEIKEKSYDLRTRGQLTIPLTRLTLGQHAVRVKGASLLN